jgi:nicotinamidase-related amidase
MELSDKTARQIWADVKANPNRARFGYGRKAVLVNIDFQCAYTKLAEFPKTAYETDPRQIEHVNALASRFRALKWPVVWTHVEYLDSAEDAGVWGTRTNTPDSLQNIKPGSRRAQLDERCDVQPADIQYAKRMPSPFFETPLQSLLVWHQVDTVVITGGSTSGCVRAGAVDSLSRGYRTIVPEQCVADKHESYHFANLTDLMLKYADVVDVNETLGWLDRQIEAAKA